MVYDNTIGERPQHYGERAASGYAIHEANPPVEGEPRYSLYTDDGRGNGDYIAGSEDIYWIRRIAFALDSQNGRDFDYFGNPR